VQDKNAPIFVFSGEGLFGKVWSLFGGKIAVELFEIIFPNKIFLYNSKTILFVKCVFEMNVLSPHKCRV
jgi:hypothetical protein